MPSQGGIIGELRRVVAVSQRYRPRSKAAEREPLRDGLCLDSYFCAVAIRGEPTTGLPMPLRQEDSCEWRSPDPC